ncbi:MAG TPA: PRC-barrel domain-containing protein [Actinocrinis sp.]|jgi:sporulation protein YlmC with PRC-barrel domain
MNAQTTPDPAAPTPADGPSISYAIGAEVGCRDGACGRLSRVIIDPVARSLAHLVVQPEDKDEAARLVPAGLVDCDAPGIELRCDKAHFSTLEQAVETEFIDLGPATAPPGNDGGWMPHATVTGGAGGGMMLPGMFPDARGVGDPWAVTRERVPAGTVQVRRGERVHALDGDIGRVRGLVVDPDSRHVTHVLLDEGHLWGKKEVAIPIGAVTAVADGIRLSLTKDDVRDLPPVGLGRRDS